jgi:Fic family protein
MKYNWQQIDWPKFSYNTSNINHLLLDFIRNSGKLEGALISLNEKNHSDTMIELLVIEAIKTSEIEGEYISRKDVASSIRKNLGLLKSTENVKDQKARGIANLLIMVRNSFYSPLSKKELLHWHQSLMSYDPTINAGEWRNHEEPMQIISGAFGKEKIHFEAPPSAIVPQEMEQFIQWFNDTAPNQPNEILHAPIRAAIAHLYFESIHPFEDGNGRIGRALAEKALAQTLGYNPLISLSATIERNKKDYYQLLERSQRKNEITEWIVYFTNTVLSAQEYTQKLIYFTIQKTQIFDAFSKRLNEAQLKVVKRIFEQGHEGFIGGMNAEKYMRISKVSKATATRHLHQLVEMGLFQIEGQGRATRYSFKMHSL